MLANRNVTTFQNHIAWIWKSISDVVGVKLCPNHVKKKINKIIAIYFEICFLSVDNKEVIES